MPLGRKKAIWMVAGLLLVGCGANEDSPFATEEPSDNILSDTVNNTSGSGSGEPGTVCDLEVYSSPIGLPDTTGDALGENGLLLTDVATDHPLITPNADNDHDTTKFNGQIYFPKPPDSIFVPYYVAWTIEILSGDSCDVATVLTDTTPLDYPPEIEVVEHSIDFEGPPVGTIVTKDFDGVTIGCANDNENHPNACILFDTTNPTGGDEDLRHEEFQNVLIIAEDVVDEDGDELVDDPDDEARGGDITLTFDGPVTLRGLGLLDIDANENQGRVVMLLADETTVEVPFFGAGDGQAQYLDLNQDEVLQAVVTLQNSGAITDIDYATEEISPATLGTARLNTEWNATDADGNILPDGGYAYRVRAELVRNGGHILDRATSPYVGLIIAGDFVDYNQQAEHSECDPNTDVYGCECGIDDENCVYEEYLSLRDFQSDPGGDAASFMTTTQDPETGRYQVFADLTSFNGGGLVPKGDGVWSDADELKSFIEALTGVPASTDERLFNFDYAQVGISTGVTATGFANTSTNVFLIDVITDTNGAIHIGGETTLISEYFNNMTNAPAQYQISNTRVNEECTEAGAYNGSTSVAGKHCVYAEGILIDSTTDLGIYSFRTAAFDVEIDGTGVTRELACDGGACAFRTYQNSAQFDIESVYYETDGTAVNELYAVSNTYLGPAVVQLVDRGPGGTLAGQCTRTVTEASDLRFRMDSADGAAGENCIINGLYE